jgi:hypothetical protein
VKLINLKNSRNTLNRFLVCYQSCLLSVKSSMVGKSSLERNFDANDYSSKALIHENNVGILSFYITFEKKLLDRISRGAWRRTLRIGSFWDVEKKSTGKNPVCLQNFERVR